MRIFAVLHDHEGVEIEKNIIERLPDGSRVMVFSKNDFKIPGISGKTVEFFKFPEEITDKKSKMRNFVIRMVKNTGFSGFLHVSEDSVALKSDPA